MAQTLDHFLPNVLTQDVKKRTQCHGELVPYLQNHNSSLYCEETDKFVDGIASWISSSNYKISLMGLEVTSLLVERMGDHFRPYVTSVIPAVVDRLGDSKDQVRESSKDVLLQLMGAATPQFVFDRSMPAFTHKLWHVREEICDCLKTVLNRYGAKSLSLSKLVPPLCKLLEDQSIPVRDASIGALVEIYRHVGERVRQDIAKKDINRQKMTLLLQKMDEMRDSGNMVADAGGGKDEVDFVKPVGVPKQAAKRTGSSSGTSTIGRRGSKATAVRATTPIKTKRRQSTVAAAGGLDEETFLSMFDDVPKVHLYSNKELSDHITRIKDTLSDHNNHEAWEKRADAVKQLRSLIHAGAVDYEDFLSHLRNLEPVLVLATKDLRSQIVREACVTLAFLSQTLRGKFDHCAEAVLPTLLALLPNSAKVMATSGRISINFIIKNTHAPRLIPLITQNLTSKASIVRRESCEFLHILLHCWPTHSLERHIAILQEAIKKGLGDADTEARVHARKAYWGFAEHFKSQADSLFESLDFSKQKHLQGEMSNSSSNNSIDRPQGAAGRVSSASSAAAAAKAKSRSRSMSTERGTNYFSRTLSGRRQNAPKVSSSGHGTEGTDSTDGSAYVATTVAGRTPSSNRLTSTSSTGIIRSSSAVDLANTMGGSGSSSGHFVKPASRMAGNNTMGNSAYNSLRYRGMRHMKSAAAYRRRALSNRNLATSDTEDEVFDPSTTSDEAVAAAAWASTQRRKGSVPEMELLTYRKGTGGMGSASSSASSVQSDLTQSCDEHTLRTSIGVRAKSEIRHSRSTADLTYARTPKQRRPSLLDSMSATRPPRKSSGVSSRKPIAPDNVLSPERSRPKSKIGVSQSQPASRSTSPSSRLSYITHSNTQQQQQQQQGASSRTPGARRSAIPRSQGASRETSPSRLHGRERKLSTGSGLRVPSSTRPAKGVGGQVLAQRVLTQGQDVEQAVADALVGGASSGRVLKKRFESYESDDAASETSSVCSERSYTSYGRTSESSYHGDYADQDKDIQEILTNLASGSWADRKEGLIYLQNMLRSGRTLNRLELKKVTDVFTRMFHDPHGKVFSMFLETMVDLLAVHKQDLHDWLYICLTRLIHKMGADMLGSLHVKVQRALECVRDAFPYAHQFNILTRFIVDQTQTPNLKVKVALMTYLHGLALLMDPADFQNTSDTRLAVSRIITWTTEPKSVDVRKAAQATLIALFNLNTPEFSMMLQVLPKTFQDGATKILHNHLRSNSGGGGGGETEPLSPRNITSPTTPARYKMTPNRGHMDEVDTENMNPEEIYNSIKKTSADIQNLSKMDSQFEELKKERDSTSQDSGIQGSMHDIRAQSPDTPQRHQRHPQPGYNPSYYQEDAMNGYNKAAMAEAVFDAENELFNEDFPGDFTDILSEILSELSNHNERIEERKNAMLQLIKLTREGCSEVWDEHFKTILLLLLETLGDIDEHIRALSLRVLREILRRQPDRFRDYAELTILKILEAHKDTSREVTRAAEECSGTLALSIVPEQCLRILVPIIQTAEFPVNLAAIKMQTKVVEHTSRESLEPLLPEVIPGLTKGYDNSESSVRKAAVFCLVAIYMLIGDDLRPHITDLNGSKMKLLNLYIKRAQSTTASASTSKTTSPTASTITDLS